MSVSRPCRLVAAVLVICLVPAVAGAAKPKSDGVYAYHNANNSKQITLNLYKGKIINAQGSMPLTKNGQLCRDNTPTGSTIYSAGFDPGRKVSKSGRFSFTDNHVSTGTPTEAKIAVSGRFTKTSKATVKVSYSKEGCSGTISTSSAKLLKRTGGGR